MALRIAQHGRLVNRPGHRVRDARAAMLCQRSSSEAASSAISPSGRYTSGRLAWRSVFEIDRDHLHFGLMTNPGHQVSASMEAASRDAAERATVPVPVHPVHIARQTQKHHRQRPQATLARPRGERRHGHRLDITIQRPVIAGEEFVVVKVAGRLARKKVTTRPWTRVRRARSPECRRLWFWADHAPPSGSGDRRPRRFQTSKWQRQHRALRRRQLSLPAS